MNGYPSLRGKAPSTTQMFQLSAARVRQDFNVPTNCRVLHNGVIGSLLSYLLPFYYVAGATCLAKIACQLKSYESPLRR